MSEKRPEDRSAYERLIRQLQSRFSTLQPVVAAPTLFLMGYGRFPSVAGRDRDIHGSARPWDSRYGTGVTVVGKRNADAETETYIKTLGLFLFGIPIVFLKAYRVLEWETGLREASAPGDHLTPAIVRYCELRGDWYFVGEEPLSGLARAWNVLVVVAVLALIVLLS